MKLKVNNVLGFYNNRQNNFNNISTNNLLIPFFSENGFNKINKDLLGKSTLNLESSFTKISKYNKLNSSNIFQTNLENLSKNSIKNSLSGELNNFNINNFKIIKKFNLLSTKTYLNNFSSLFDLKSVKKFLFKNNNNNPYTRLSFNSEYTNSNSLENLIFNYTNLFNNSKFKEIINNKLSNKFNQKSFNFFFNFKFKNVGFYNANNSKYIDNSYEYSNFFNKSYLNSNQKNSLFKEFSKVSKFNTFSSDNYLFDSNTLELSNNYNVNLNISPVNMIKNNTNSLNNLMSFKKSEYKHLNDITNISSSQNFLGITSNNVLSEKFIQSLNTIKGSNKMFTNSNPSFSTNFNSL
jgi:hypothetical protein